MQSLTTDQLRARLALLQEEIAEGRINGVCPDITQRKEAQARALQDRIKRQEEKA
jgi:hypothetical protein